MAKLILNAKFFEQWNQAYDQVVKDETLYQKLVTQVLQEITQVGKINYRTFYQIVIWKSPRIKNFFTPKNFLPYQQALSDCCHLPLPESVQKLNTLRGIGLPVASTLLHFLRPKFYTRSQAQSYITI